MRFGRFASNVVEFHDVFMTNASFPGQLDSVRETMRWWCCAVSRPAGKAGLALQDSVTLVAALPEAATFVVVQARPQPRIDVVAKRHDLHRACGIVLALQAGLRTVVG